MDLLVHTLFRLFTIFVKDYRNIDKVRQLVLTIQHTNVIFLTWQNSRRPRQNLLKLQDTSIYIAY